MNSFALQNLRVLEHSNSILSKTILNTNFKIAIEERKLNLLRKNFNSMSLHTLVIDFVKFFSRKSNIFWNLRVLYTDIFTLKAYNSAEKQQMTEIF